jgi:hypothetical protein
MNKNQLRKMREWKGRRLAGALFLLLAFLLGAAAIAAQERLRWTKDYVYANGQLVATVMRNDPNAQMASIDRLYPRIVVQGSVSATLKLTVIGVNFSRTSLVNFAGTPVATTFDDSMKLTAYVPAALLGVLGTRMVWVVSGGQATSALPVNVIRAPTFVDVPVTHYAVNFVETFYAGGFTAGCSAQPMLFCPETAVTRGQMAVFLMRAVDMAPDPNGTPLFNDIQGHYARAFIQRAAQLGLVAGCGGASFCPDAPLRRGEMAVWMLKALGLQPNAAGAQVFNDVSPASHPYEYGYVQVFARLGITAGCSASPPLYCPDSLVTRAQVAVFITVGF